MSSSFHFNHPSVSGFRGSRVVMFLVGLLLCSSFAAHGQTQKLLTTPYSVLGSQTPIATVNASNVAVDSKDDVYFSDFYQNTINKIDPQGNVTLVPTTGLNSPQGMRFDAADNLYICDASNGRVVVVTAAGVQATLAVTGLQQPRYLAFDSGYANLYVSDRYAGILEYNLASQKTTVYATNLFRPQGIALDAQNNVYYGDGGTLVKNKVSFSTSVGEPDGLIFDKAGNLYIEGSALYRMDPSGTILQLADEGTNDIAIDSHGLLYMPAHNEQHMLVYIADPAVWGGRNSAFVGGRVSNQYANSIRIYYTVPVGVTLSSLTIPTAGSPYSGDNSPSCATSTLCGANLSLGAFLPGPQPGYGVATFSDGTKVNTPLYGSGVQVEIGFSPGIASQKTTGVNQYGGAANDLNGSVYVSDTAANKVFKMTGSTVTPLAFVGLNAPTQLALDGTGSVYVLDSGSQRIVKLDNSGKQTVAFDRGEQATTLPTLSSVQSFTVDGATNLFLSGPTTAKTAVIELYGANGVLSVYATPPSVSTALAFDTYGTLYAAEAQGALVKYDHFANRLPVATGVPAAGSIAIEPSGTVYLASNTSSTLTQVPPTGSATAYQVTGVKLASVVTADNYGNLSVGDNSTQLLTFDDRTTQPYAFGNVTVGTSSTLHRSLLNVGSRDGLTISSISGGGPFVVDSGTTTCMPGTTSLVAGGSCEIGLTFTPTAVSSYSSTGQVVIPLPTPNYSATVANLALSGNGVKLGPVANAGGPYSGTTGSAVSFSGLASSDPGNEALTYAWSFGDNSSGTGATPSHTYAAAGTYTVTLTVTNTDGATASATATATIAQSYTATLAPGTSDFGSVAIGSSQIRVFTLTNTGATAMSVGGVAISAPVFTLSSQTCGTTLAAGASCTYAIAYTPTATGAASATFSVTDTAGTQSSALTATGIPAGSLAITPAVQQFPATAAGATVAVQTSTISNTTAQAIYLSSGSLTDATDFAETDNCNGLIAAGGTCTVSYSFIPKTTGALTSTYNIHNLNTPASVLSVALSGIATGAPVATFNPGSVTFSTTFNTPASNQTVTLTNSGNAPLTIGSLTLGGVNPGAFAIVSQSCGAVLAAGSSCTVMIGFTQTAVGVSNATLTATDNASPTTQAVALTGTVSGVAGASLTPATLAFTSVVGTASAAQTLTLTNTGSAALTIIAVAVGGTSPTLFTEATTCGATLAVAASCSIGVAFKPSAAGTYTATLSVTDNAASSPQTTVLTGTATAVPTPQAALTPVSASFAAIVGTTSAAQVFTLSNTGNATLPITSIAVAGSTFGLTANTCGPSLAAAASCTVSITFSPFSVGTAAGTLTVVDSIGTQTSALTGTGNSTVTADFSVTATPAAQTSYRGRNVSYTLQLASLLAAAPFNNPVVLSAANLPAGVTASFSPASVLPGTAQATSVMTLSIPAIVGQSASQQRRSASGAIYFSALLVGLFWVKRGKRRSRMLPPLAILLLLAGLSFSITGCGTGNGFGVPTSTSTITVIGTGGATVHTTTVSLTIQ